MTLKIDQSFDIVSKSALLTYTLSGNVVSVFSYENSLFRIPPRETESTLTPDSFSSGVDDLLSWFKHIRRSFGVKHDYYDPKLKASWVVKNKKATIKMEKDGKLAHDVTYNKESGTLTAGIRPEVVHLTFVEFEEYLNLLLLMRSITRRGIN